jgi:CRP/FNR family transcriptional regulator, anaerobic regulatory protein
MTKTRSSRTECAKCPLQECEGLRALDPKQIAFMQGFKQGEMAVDKGTQVLVQGAISPHLYTVLEGVLMRFRLLEDGRRQTVNFMFPGDLLGLQGAMDDPLTHGAEALTDATLCVFSRDRLIELYRDAPRLGFDVTWLAAKEEAALEEHLVSLGQRNAKERIVCLALILMRRGIETGVAKGGKLALGITQAQIADMLGLSLVHTNRTLQALRRSGLVAWSLTEITIPDLDAAEEYAALDAAISGGRPFI